MLIINGIFKKKIRFLSSYPIYKNLNIIFILLEWHKNLFLNSKIKRMNTMTLHFWRLWLIYLFYFKKWIQKDLRKLQ